METFKIEKGQICEKQQIVTTKNTNECKENDNVSIAESWTSVDESPQVIPENTQKIQTNIEFTEIQKYVINHQLKVLMESNNKDNEAKIDAILKKIDLEPPEIFIDNFLTELMEKLDVDVYSYNARLKNIEKKINELRKYSKYVTFGNVKIRKQHPVKAFISQLSEYLCEAKDDEIKACTPILEILFEQYATKSKSYPIPWTQTLIDEFYFLVKNNDHAMNLFYKTCDLEWMTKL